MPTEDRTRLTEDRRLEGLRAVTDVALAYLDLDELLNEMLDRVLEALGAQTAAVLLIDESETELVARAARGIEQEVRQGVRVPIGIGFAGHVAAERRPIALESVNADTVSNPLLWEAGITSMLGVPLYSGSAVIGVLHVGTRSGRIFTADDEALLQVAADRIAMAVRLRLLESERGAAEALQRSLLPGIPPRIGGLEFSARYVPTGKGGIGGDWYDIFRTPDDSVWIVVGDVAGHGLRSAVVMGRVRSALRAYALVGAGPDEVLALTDRKVQHFEVGHLVTVLVAVLSPPYDHMDIALAGHMPPIFVSPDVPASFLDAEAGPPLGAAVDPEQWPVTSVPFDPGSVAVLYTDGLVERRGESLDVGLERLRASVRAEAAGEVCRHVMASSVGDRIPGDDIALLAVRRVDPA
jgi:serine phosphatase RsbU (regulator of sigma subunit)